MKTFTSTEMRVTRAIFLSPSFSSHISPDTFVLSAIVLGAMIALAARPPLWIAATVVGAFAVFHGHAHGTELPQAANALAFSAGFVIATGLLHLSGIAFGLIVKWPKGRIAVRVVGGAIAAAGVGFLVGVF